MRGQIYAGQDAGRGYLSDAGMLRLNGQEVHFSSTADAAAHGVASCLAGIEPLSRSRCTGKSLSYA